jgi:riboflavin biosynthesis pyrimidine reductase
MCVELVTILVDELLLSLAPTFLGGGVRLFKGIDKNAISRCQNRGRAREARSVGPSSVGDIEDTSIGRSNVELSR